MIAPAAHDALRDLGFSDMEARTYLALVQHGPQSGYALAKTIAKANSNTYTALEGLERRGAVVASDGTPRTYRAVPPDNLLDVLERDFQEQQERARRELATLSHAAADDESYRLQRPDQVLDCARSLLDRSEKVALVDAFPDALQSLRDEIESATNRGVTVVVKAYVPADLDAARIVLQKSGADVVARYRGATWLNVSIDGREALISLLEPELQGVRSATWVRNRHVAWTFHCGLACEIAFAVLGDMSCITPEKRISDALPEIHELIFNQARGYMDADA